MQPKQVLEIALYAGEILLSNGAEVYRIEETIENISRAYGLKCECMATGKGVFVSIVDEGNEKVTSLKRIRTKRVDLYRIELVNNFSRNIQREKFTYDEAKRILKDIDDAPYFSFRVRLFAAIMTSFVYALFFNGTMYDALVSAIIAAGIYIMLEKVSKVGFFQFSVFFFSGLIIGGVSLSAEALIPFVLKENVITGTIMILIPGVALTNGIKDIIYGEFTAGVVKFGESMLLIIALGAGIATSLALGTGVRTW